MAQGFKNFAAGAVLGETDLDDYLMRQSVMVFGSAAARNSALSGVLLEGMVSYLTDVNVLQMYNGASWIDVLSLQEWGTYTPTCFQEDGTGQGLVLSGGTFARYQRQGRTITGSTNTIINTAGSSTNGESIIMSMPVAPFDTTSLNQYVGVGAITDLSAATTWPVAVINYGGAFRFKRTDAIASSLVGVDPGFALAAGDTISFNYQYEGAS